MKVLRLIKIAFLVVFAFGLVVVGLANTNCVTVRLLPSGLSDAVGLVDGGGWFLSDLMCGADALPAAEGWSNQIQLPVIVLILLALVMGVIVGYVWDWLREHRHRAEAKYQRREATRLGQEVAALKGGRSTDKPGDDILALMDDASAAR